MANPNSQKGRVVSVLAFAFVLVFIVFVAWETWLKPAPSEQIAANTATAAATATSGPAPDCTDVSKLPADYAILGLKDGCVEIQFLPNLAPHHVAQIEKLISQKFYDGLVFHRVIAGFMAQTGDPTGTGAGGSDLPNLNAEFSNEPFVRGVLGMARTSDPNSANSQFFIMYDTASQLNGQYTVFGKVVSGMEYVDNIKKGDPARNGLVTNPDKIITFRASTK